MSQRDIDGEPSYERIEEEAADPDKEIHRPAPAMPIIPVTFGGERDGAAYKLHITLRISSGFSETGIPAGAHRGGVEELSLDEIDADILDRLGSDTLRAGGHSAVETAATPTVTHS